MKNSAFEIKRKYQIIRGLPETSATKRKYRDRLTENLFRYEQCVNIEEAWIQLRHANIQS